MVPFEVEFTPRQPIFDQVCFAATRSILARAPSIDARTQQAIEAATRAPDYAAVKVPALATYAVPEPDRQPEPWYDAVDETLLANLAEFARVRRTIQRENIEIFRRGVAQGQVLGAAHNVVLSNPQEVLRAIEQFIRSPKREA
jgi:hypothetical protein